MRPGAWAVQRGEVPKVRPNSAAARAVGAGSFIVGFGLRRGWRWSVGPCVDRHADPEQHYEAGVGGGDVGGADRREAEEAGDGEPVGDGGEEGLVEAAGDRDVEVEDELED